MIRNWSKLLLENFMLFPTLCRNLAPLFDGEVVHVPHAVGGGRLEGEVVLVLHAVGAGHTVDTKDKALLDGTLEGEVAHVLRAEGAGHVVDTEVESLDCKALVHSLMADTMMKLSMFSTQ